MSNGVNMKFWIACWICNTPLREQFSCLFLILDEEEATLSKIWVTLRRVVLMSGLVIYLGGGSLE